MRGGDRLVNECSYMNGICFDFHHLTEKSETFKLSPPLISQPCRFRSAVKPGSFPPGEAKGQLRELVPFNVLLYCGNCGRLRASPTHMIPFNEHGCGDFPQMQKGTAEAVPLWIIC